MRSLRRFGGWAARRYLREHGVRLYYHNHDFEFDRVDGVLTGMDLLCVGLDPDAIELCVDAGWVWWAGVDPAESLRSQRERIGLVHLRDFAGPKSLPLDHRGARPRLDRPGGQLACHPRFSARTLFFVTDVTQIREGINPSR